MNDHAGKHETTGGAELCYELRGEGPTITFVNSFFMPSSSWGLFTEELAPCNRLLTYDLGPANWSGETIVDFDHYISDLDDLLDALEIESTYLLGHSSGTQICAAYAAAHCERVCGLVLVGPLVNPTGGERRREIVAAWNSAYLAGGWEGLFDLLWWLVYSESTIRRAGRIGRRIMRARFAELNAGTNPLALFALSDEHQVGFAPDWKRITVPTLLITGEDDAVATTGALRETRELIPNSELVLIPRAGHVVYLEATSAFQAEVQRFVDRVEAACVRPLDGRV